MDDVGGRDVSVSVKEGDGSFVMLRWNVRLELVAAWWWGRVVIDSDRLWRDYRWAADCVVYMVERLWIVDNATRRDERVG